MFLADDAEEESLNETNDDAMLRSIGFNVLQPVMFAMSTAWEHQVSLFPHFLFIGDTTWKQNIHSDAACIRLNQQSERLCFGIV